MRFREARGLEVVSTADAVAVARVDGYVIDPASHRVTALRLAGVDDGGPLVGYGDLRGFGRDAVTIDDRSVLRRPRDDTEQRALDGALDVLGKRILTEFGDEIGHVVDVEFDPSDGTVTEVLTPTDTLAGSRLVGVGSYAVVVSASDVTSPGGPPGPA